MLLRNFNNANKYFDFESNKEKVILSNPRIIGWYTIHNGIRSELFVTDNQLYFVFGKQKNLITDFHTVFLEVNEVRNMNFVLRYKEVNQIQFEYLASEINLNVSPFEYIDDEDFKWEEFIKNIINDPNRKTNFIKNLMETD